MSSFRELIFLLFFFALEFCSGCSKGKLSLQKDATLASRADSIEAALIEHYEKGFKREADSLLDVVFQPDELEDRYVLKKYIGLKGLFRVKEGRYAEALGYSTKYLSIIDTTNMEEHHEYVFQLTSHGSIYYNLQNYNAAYRYYHKARRNYKDNKCFVAYSDYSIAMVLYRQEDYSSAANTFKQAFEGYKTCNYLFETELRKQEILSNTGLCYFHLEQYDSALHYYKLAGVFIDSMKASEPSHHKWKEIAHAVVAGNKSKVFLAMDNMDSALHYALQDVSVNLKPSYDLKQGITSLLVLAKIQLEKGHLFAMDTTLQLAKTLMAESENSGFKLDWLNLKRNYAHANRQWDSAAHYANQYIQLQDSVNEAERKAFNSHVQLALKNIDSEYELGLLRKENEYRTQSFNYLLWILLLVNVVVLTSVFFLFHLRKKNKLLGRKSRELASRNRELQQLNTEKDRILSIAAHDLRTPIAGIVSLVKMLREGSISAEERQQITGLIETSGKSSLELISEILLSGDLKDDKLSKERISVNEFLTTTGNLIRYKALEKRQKLKFQLLEEDIVIEADPNKLRRAISNLISNAVKFSKEDSTISVDAVIDDGRVRFKITDEGIGIPMQLRGEMFDSFTKSKRPGTNGEKPFGLGLSIVKQIIQKHQGKVWFESNNGKGSVFFVELPAK